MSATFVDWEFAKTTAARLANPGPALSETEAQDVVAEIRQLAAEAVEPVAHTAQLRAPGSAPAPFVVDRISWINANVDSTELLLSPVIDKVAAHATHQPGPWTQAIGSKLTGAEVAGMLAYLSAKILGQYDLAPGGTPKLLLVAPNMVAVERELQANPRDFRAWVCLHEETHRVQFTAVPWLRAHLIEQAQALAVDIAPTPADLKARLDQLLTGLPDLLRGEGGGLIELFATPKQRAQLADLTAIMSLLEGHADVVMDAVGPEYIPSVDEIRAKFEQRRKGAGTVDRLLRRLLGLEAKMRQYRDGAAFVRAVQDKVGVAGFNAVWTDPSALPLASEITDPARWLSRVHG